jgi:hypothetical protein
MRGDRGLANDQSFGYLSIGKATPDQHDHFHLSGGQTMSARAVTRRAGLLREHHRLGNGLRQ